MIIEFSVQNFRSIKEMQTLSMVAAPLKSKNPQLDKDNVIRVSDKLSLLKSAAIYGANGTGKSNFISAMLQMLLVVQKSMENERLLNLSFEPFAMDNESVDLPTFFQIQFIINQKKYRYGFEYNNERIVSEWLFGMAEKNEVYYFTRELDEIKINENQFKEGKNLTDKTSPTNLFLNVTNAFNGEISKQIKKYFNHDLFVDFKKQKTKRSLTVSWLEKPYFKNQIIKLLNFADLNVDDIRIDLQEESEDIIFFKRNIVNDSGKIIGSKLMSIDRHESDGTRNFFNHIGIVYYALVSGLTLVLDEFEASLHPILAKKIVEMFHSPKLNKKGAQLIFATHDTNLLDANLLRRDQIFFTEKNKKNETELYSLYDFKGVRNDASYEKDYIKGKYGAIPFVGDFETLFEEAV